MGDVVALGNLTLGENTLVGGSGCRHVDGEIEDCAEVGLIGKKEDGSVGGELCVRLERLVC